MKSLDIVVPFRAAVVVISFNGAERFLKADVIEAGKRRASDVLDCMIRNQEVFLAHHSEVIGYQYLDDFDDGREKDSVLKPYCEHRV